MSWDPVLCGLSTCPWNELAEDGDATVCSWPKLLRLDSDTDTIQKMMDSDAPCVRWSRPLV